MPVFPGIGTFQQIISSGVSAIGSWIRFAFGSLQEQERYLSFRYPDAPPQTINQVAGYLEMSSRAATQLESGLGLPPLEQVPVNPNIPERAAYQVDVVIKVPDPSRPGKLGGGKYSIIVPGDLAEEEILDFIYDYLAEQWQEGNCGESPDLENCDEIDLTDVNWKIVILGVTRS